MNQTQIWYEALNKPQWAPPSSVFAPVWLVLYILIAISFGYVFYKALKREVPRGVWLPFALNLVFNLAYSPIQFGLQNNLLASLDILLVLGTLIWALLRLSYAGQAMRGRMKWVIIANIPYLAWVSFATLLQLTIVYLNL